ncbi:MAG: hypothetical protein RRB13_01780 [bacterium]|nr:hypothetical protein [bacterium]
MYSGVSLDQAPPLWVPFRFFVTAPAFGCLGGLYLTGRAEEILASPLLGPAIAWVHLWTLGWLAMVMFGAFYQMIPVMIGGQVPLPGWSLWVYLLLAGGTLSMVLFFETWASFWAVAALAGLGLAVGLFLVQIAVALARVSGTHRPTLLAMRLSAASLLLVWLFGWARLGELAGYFALPGPLREAHFSVALIGWVGFLVIGVSYHLIPMFYVCPHFEPTRAFRVLRLIAYGLLGLLVSLGLGASGPWLLPAGAFIAAGLWLYLVEFRRVVMGRRRKRMDPALKLLRWAMLGLATSLAGILVGLTSNHLILSEAAGLLFLFAFALTATHAMLYKIFTFLVWFHRYSHQIGKPGAPLLGDLMSETQQLRESWALLVALGLLALGFLLSSPVILAFAGLGLAGDHIYLGYLFLNALKDPKRVEG